MDNFLKCIHFSLRDDMDFWIHSAEKWGIRFGIDLITIELESWNREECTCRNIAPRTDDTSRFIGDISHERDIYGSYLCDSIFFLGSRDIDP